MGRKTELKDCSEGYVYARCVNTARKPTQRSCKTTNQQSFVNRITRILTSLENKQTFYFIFVRLKPLSENKQLNKMSCVLRKLCFDVNEIQHFNLHSLLTKVLCKDFHIGLHGGADIRTDVRSYIQYGLTS